LLKNVGEGPGVIENSSRILARLLYNISSGLLPVVY
jgi:hypothetical protein